MGLRLRTVVSFFKKRTPGRVFNLGSVASKSSGPFHKSSYERFLLYEFVEPVLNYGSNEIVALTNLCETGLSTYHWNIHDDEI